WGQKVCAVIILRENDKREQGRVLPGLEQSIRNWAKEKMASYKVPSAIKIVDQLPRNSLGKVVKPEVIKSF
ncbi:MAG TPA: hypothetical protein VHL10_01745, partial [Nitrososphaera sp.]|nr:hypothetical protein [Nitrososphaera sp.]